MRITKKAQAIVRDDFAGIVIRAAADICMIADDNKIDRDALMRLFADYLKYITEVGSFSDFKGE